MFMNKVIVDMSFIGLRIVWLAQKKRDTVPIVSNTKLPSSVTLISLKGVRRQSNLRVSEAITDYVASFELQEIIIPPRYKMMVVVDKEQYDWLPSQSLGVTLMKGALNL